MWMHMVRTVGCIISLCAVIGFGQACLNRTSKMWGFFMRRSFWIYYLHMVIVVAVGYYILRYVKKGGLAQGGLIIGISVIVTFLLVEVFMRLRWGTHMICHIGRMRLKNE